MTRLNSPLDGERRATCLAHDDNKAIIVIFVRVGLALFRRVEAREGRGHGLGGGEAEDAEPEGGDGGDVGTHCER